MRKTTKRKKKAATTLHECKMSEMRKKDRDIIDKNKNQIRAIASFLHNLTQLVATPETVAVAQTPNLRDDELFETPKRTIRHVSAETPFSYIKDEEEEGRMTKLKGYRGKSLQ